jgi:hypothetical protein
MNAPWSSSAPSFIRPPHSPVPNVHKTPPRPSSTSSLSTVFETTVSDRVAESCFPPPTLQEFFLSSDEEDKHPMASFLLCKDVATTTWHIRSSKRWTWVQQGLQTTLHNVKTQATSMKTQPPDGTIFFVFQMARRLCTECSCENDTSVDDSEVMVPQGFWGDDRVPWFLDGIND